MTYSEAAQLVYSAAVKSGFATDVTQMSINRYSPEMAGEGIDEWAKSGCFCMEKGILNSYDLTKFKENGNDVKITRGGHGCIFRKSSLLLTIPYQRELLWHLTIHGTFRQRQNRMSKC